MRYRALHVMISTYEAWPRDNFVSTPGKESIASRPFAYSIDLTRDSRSEVIVESLLARVTQKSSIIRGARSLSCASLEQALL
jgi:hypothetical protein